MARSRGPDEAACRPGLEIDDEARCLDLLSRVGYYHLSGYTRYFQVDPSRGGNDFKPGTCLADIEELQRLDEELRHLCLRYLGRVEIAMRTVFALRYGERVGAYEPVLAPGSFHSTGATSTPVHDLVLDDLDRCKTPFVARHREETPHYQDLPVWVAVEALSFGTFSKCIAYVTNDAVANAMADDFGVAHKGFSSQVRSFVSLRNACAHHARLWNDVNKNPPIIPPHILKRIKRAVGQFDPKSQLHALAALDRYTAGRVEGEPPLLYSVTTLMETNETFAQGMRAPTPY